MCAENVASAGHARPRVQAVVLVATQTEGADPGVLRRCENIESERVLGWQVGGAAGAECMLAAAFSGSPLLALCFSQRFWGAR